MKADQSVSIRGAHTAEFASITAGKDLKLHQKSEFTAKNAVLSGKTVTNAGALMGKEYLKVTAENELTTTASSTTASASYMSLAGSQVDIRGKLENTGGEKDSLTEVTARTGDVAIAQGGHHGNLSIDAARNATLGGQTYGMMHD